MNKIIFLCVCCLITGCSKPLVIDDAIGPTKENLVAVGYGAMNQYLDYPEPQQHLLAIRAAKLDAYRSLAEELYGTEIRSNTTVRDMAVQNDSYRSYVHAVVRGARLRNVTLKSEGIYEAEVELRWHTALIGCLQAPSADCYAQYELALERSWALGRQSQCNNDCWPGSIGF